MVNISVKVTAADKKRIERLLASGSYSTQSEILRAGLRKLKVRNK